MISSSKVIDVPRTTRPYQGADVVFCRNCIMPSTRPRIEFDDRGWCNACVWAEAKRAIVDWKGRWNRLESLCERVRRTDGFDCLVGVSGGKDGGYVAHRLKNDLGMHPLTVTVSVPLSMTLGNDNLERFKASGFDHLQISPNPLIARRFDRLGFIEQGRPMYGWQINLQVAVLRAAIAFEVPLIMYGEDGEVEYGGSTETMNEPTYSVAYAKRVYLSGHDPAEAGGRIGADVTASDLAWWTFPPLDSVARVNPLASHWSYFENWDPYQHYLVAKQTFGMQEREDASPGTYTNYAQTDTSLFDLHMYMAFLKFGWGRCTHDAGMDIRRGAMTRKQAVELVRIYDWQPPPEESITRYCEYFELTRPEFDAVLDRHADPRLMAKEDGVWKPRYPVQ